VGKRRSFDEVELIIYCYFVVYPAAIPSFRLVFAMLGAESFVLLWLEASSIWLSIIIGGVNSCSSEEKSAR
jgi:hypothetical protein